MGVWILEGGFSMSCHVMSRHVGTDLKVGGPKNLNFQFKARVIFRPRNRES